MGAKGRSSRIVARTHRVAGSGEARPGAEVGPDEDDRLLAEGVADLPGGSGCGPARRNPPLAQTIGASIAAEAQRLRVMGRSGAEPGWSCQPETKSEKDTDACMQTRSFPAEPDGRSPAGAQIRYLIEGEPGAMIHSTVPPGQVNRATVHATVSEFWYVLSGAGQIWRRDATGEETTALASGVTIDIPVGTAFQYRCTGDRPLEFLCITMPPWPGDQEATVIEGPWTPNAPEG